MFVASGRGALSRTNLPSPRKPQRNRLKARWIQIDNAGRSAIPKQRMRLAARDASKSGANLARSRHGPAVTCVVAGWVEVDNALSRSVPKKRVVIIAGAGSIARTDLEAI